jgi:hypothetical protein
MVEFTPTHHALLFAWIAESIIQAVGEEHGQPAVRKAVRRYGEERGGRMAQRAVKDGLKPDMTAYMAYGEWQAAPGSFDSAMVTAGETPRSHVFRCPWHQAWVNNGINETGRLYCLEIDESLGRGFGLDVNLEITGTRSNGAEACEFIYHGADLEALAKIHLDTSKIVKPWAYHLGHLFKTMRTVLEAEFGEVGLTAVDAGLEKFKTRFGGDAVEKILRYQNTDFENIQDE